MSKFRKGQIVRITDNRYPDFKIEGLVTKTDASYIHIEGQGWIGMGRSIEVIKEAPVPFYENVVRDPVVGDIYLWSAGELVGPTVNTINSAKGLEDFPPRRRVLIYDGIANTTVHGARW